MLRFGRTTIENRFKVLRAAVSRAFEDTDLDPEQIIEEYVRLKCAPSRVSDSDFPETQSVGVSNTIKSRSVLLSGRIKEQV